MKTRLEGVRYAFDMDIWTLEMETMLYLTRWDHIMLFMEHYMVQTPKFHWLLIRCQISYFIIHVKNECKKNNMFTFTKTSMTAEKFQGSEEIV
jgi:hypothetical protein